MAVKLSSTGFALEAGGFTFHFYIGDVFVRIPRIVELAWNSTGFYVDKPQ